MPELILTMIKYFHYICVGIIILLCGNQASAKAISDIIHSIVYERNEVDYLILHELIFHPTSKTYEQGNFRSIGYNEMSLSVYDISTGELITKKDLGALDDENKWVLLGCVDNLVFLYTSHDNKGFVSLDINTLETKTTFENYMINRDFGDAFINTDWQNMYNNFAYNPFANALVFTDTLNKRYTCNINNYEVNIVSYKIKTITRSDFYETIIMRASKEYSFTRGSLPCILIDGEITKHCFYDGHFIMEQNPIKQFNYLLDLKNKMDDLRDEKYKKSEVLKYANNPYYTVLEIEVDSLDGLVASNNTRIKNLLKGYRSSEILIQDKAKTVFIAHRNTIKSDALLSISKIEIEQQTILFKPWTTVLPGMYYNIAEAGNSSAFMRSFPDGTPETEYINYHLIDDKLLVIYLLQMCLIDIHTGEIIWRKRL